ncbi:LacI family DNA-binding transcriptional regulator [Humibacter antri]
MAQRPARTTMAAVAAAAGVSVMTVSYTYSRPDRVAAVTRQRVEAAAAELGYHGPDPTGRLLKRGRSNTLGVIVGEGLPYAFDDPESARFLAGVASVCVEYEQNMMLIPINDDAGDRDRIQEAVVDAFIWWTGVSDGPVLDALLATGKRLAIQGSEPHHLRKRLEEPGRQRHGGVRVISIDDFRAAQDVALETLNQARAPAVVSFSLVPSDHARLVYGPDPDEAEIPNARERLRGFRAACEQRGFEWSRVPVAVVSRNDRQDAVQIVDDLLGLEPRPDAVMTMSDQLALAVADAAGLLRLPIPDHIAISGWDDSTAAAEHGLTSVHQSLYEQGASCAGFAIKKAPRRATSEWSLAVRASTRRSQSPGRPRHGRLAGDTAPGSDTARE